MTYCITWETVQYSLISHNGKEYEKQYIYVCINESLYTRN